MVGRQSLRWSNLNSPKHHPLNQRTISTCWKSGSRKKCSQSKTFWAGTITQTMSQNWRLCKKSRVLSQQMLYNIHARVYITQPGQHLSAHFYRCKFLSIYRKRKNLLSKVRETMVGRPSIHVKLLTHTRKSWDVCKAVVKKASQL